jgi:hypothetical protein
MCTSAPKAPDPPKFNDPRLKDKEYKAVAKDLGIKNFSKPQQIYRVEKVIARNKENEYQTTLDTIEQTNANNRADDIARANAQYEEMSRIQQQQFEQSMAAQSMALQAQLEAQDRLQQRAEESSLRSQVPQFVNNSSNARRVKAKKSGRAIAQQASRGASQLRIPLSINSGSSSPVKLNIGS